MRKLFTFAAAMLASLTMMAQTEIFSFTVTSSTTAKGTYPATGGSAVLAGSAMSTGGSNEVTVGDQTFYKFSSSSKWTFSLTEGTFADGDVIAVTGACGSSDKTGKGVKLAGSIAVTGNFPKNTANTITYTVVTGDGIAGQSSFTLERNDSDIKFGTITITRPAAIVDPVATVTVSGPTRGTAGYASAFSASTDVKADAYKWFVNNAEQSGETAKTFNFTPAAAGDYSIVCKARNANNATDEWIASDAIAFKALSTLCGELIKATLTSGTAATVTGAVGGTADVSLSSGKKMDKGKYFGISLAAGSFAEGDTVIITMTTAGGNYPCLFADKERTNCLFLATEGSSDLVYKIVLPAAATGLTSLYLARDADDATYKWNPVLASMAVVRPMPTLSVTESLIAVTVDSVVLSAANLATLQADHAVTLAEEYLNAPVVTFTKHIVTIYEDNSQTTKDEEIVVTASEVASTWQAKATINNIEYTVSAAKLTSAVVTYMDGETILGTENVSIGGHPTEYAQYQNKPLFDFVGWYSDSTLTTAVANIAAEVINSAKTYYAKFERGYIASLNIEQLVLDNGTKYNIKNALTAAKIEYASIDALDSLNDDKTARNEPYLGLKIKTAGAYIAGWLKANDVLRVKFGNLPDSILVTMDNQAAPAHKTGVYEYTATADTYIKLATPSKSTVVLKQIQVNHAIEDVVLPAQTKNAVTCEKAENGKVSVKAAAFSAGDSVIVTATPNKGYKVASVKYNDGEDHIIEDVDGVYAFVMPDTAVTVSATFEAILYKVTIAAVEHGSIEFGLLTTDSLFNYGDTVRIVITPDNGYEIKSAKAGSKNLSTDSLGYYFVMPDAAVTISTTFAAIKYTITCAEAENGSIKANKTTAYMGDTITLTLKPAANYQVASVTVGDAIIVPVEGVYSFVMPAQNVTVSATFEPVVVPVLGYSITIDDDNLPCILGYSATHVQDSLVAEGTVVTVTCEGMEEGYRLKALKAYKTGEPTTVVAISANNTFTMPAYDVTITAEVELIPAPAGYSITIDDDELPCILGYSATHVQDSLIAEGTVVTLTCEGMDENYRLKMFKAYKTGEPTTIVEISANNTFTMPAYDVTITAEVEEIPVTPTYYVQVDGRTMNGSVCVETVGSSMYFEEGTEITLCNVPDEGYVLDQYIVYKTADQNVKVTVTNGKFTMPAYDVTVSGTFKAKEEGIEDINANGTAVKRMINGVLVIEKNGKFFNAQGAELR